MKQFLFIFSLTLLFFSCKKEEDTTCPNSNPTTSAAIPANNYMQLAAGNYWVYDQYKVDTNGVETLQSSTDSSYVLGDTIYNGNTYHMLFDFFNTVWLRDSSGFMVDTSGIVYFTNVIFNLPVSFTYYPGGFGYNEKMTVSTPVSVTVPAGTFTTYDWKITAHFTDPNYPWAPIRYAHDYYSEGVGKVKQVFFYASAPDHWERRLNHYHVQ